MNSQQFGSLALQLLQSANIPGNAIDVAMQFRAIATDLAEGASRIESISPGSELEPNCEG